MRKLNNNYPSASLIWTPGRCKHSLLSSGTGTATNILHYEIERKHVLLNIC
jgi:hypothetical protein